jgi:hypothetical protein
MGDKKEGTTPLKRKIQNEKTVGASRQRRDYPALFLCRGGGTPDTTGKIQIFLLKNLLL